MRDLLLRPTDLVWRFDDGVNPAGFEPLLAGATWAGKAATAMVVDGHELNFNDEFTTNLSGWSSVASAVLTRRDYTVSPAIAPTGGEDDYGIEVASSGSVASAAARYLSALTVDGVRYRVRARAYAPSANTAANVARLQTWDGAMAQVTDVTVEDAWADLETQFIRQADTVYMRLVCNSATAGDLAHFDRVSLQTMLAPFACKPRRPYGSVLGKVITPASGVVPRSLIFRASDALNTWEVRVVPGTAGADLLLGYRNAGTWYNVASADVDWTVNGTDDVAVQFFGQAIEVYSRKAGEIVWTKKISETGQTFNATARRHGWMGWGTANSMAEIVVSDRRLI